MTISLYPHQENFITDIREALRSNQAVLAQASTGFGKTVIATSMVKAAVAKGKRVIFSVHRKDLIKQTAETFKQFNIHFGYIAAGMRPNPFAPVQIASINTLQNNPDKYQPPDLLIPDEAHLSMAAGWRKTVNYYKSKGSKIVGLTATPWRLSGEGLGELYDVMVEGPSMSWLIQNGFLSDYKIYAPSTPDLSSVHSRMGDFINSELETTMDKPVITGNAISHYLKLARGKRTLVFCTSIKHSQHVAEQFRNAGIMAVHIDGETPCEDKIKAFEAFASRDILVITSVAIFSEGFDLSAQIGQEVPIEATISLRPTQSLTLHLQQMGRGLRRKPYPAIILDHSGNTLRLGLPDDERDWTLEGKKRSKKDKNEVAIRQCPKCFAVHRPVPVCPSCGFVYEVKGRPDIEVVDGELQELDKDAMRRKRFKEQSKAQTIDELVALAKARKYKSPMAWAGYIFTARMAKRR